MSRIKILTAIFKEIGYLESPINKTKFGEWFGYDGHEWCGMFASWGWASGDHPLPNIGWLKGFAGVPILHEWAIRNSKIVKDPRPGDLVIFDWNGDGNYDVAFFIGWLNEVDGEFMTVEGNSSSTTAAKAVGGAVELRLDRDLAKASPLFVRPYDI